MASSPKSAPAIVQIAAARVVAIEDFVNWIGHLRPEKLQELLAFFDVKVAMHCAAVSADWTKYAHVRASS